MVSTFNSFLWFTVASLLGGLAQRYIAFNFDYPVYYPDALRDPFMYFPKISKLIAAIYPPMFMAAAIKLLKFWYANQACSSCNRKNWKRNSSF